MRLRHRWLLVVLASAGVALGVYHNHRTHHNQPNLMTALVRSVVIPFENGIRSLTNGVSGWLSTLTRAQQVVRSHDELAQENARLRMELERLQALQQENRQMQKLLQVRPSLPGEWVGARVIAYYLQPGQQTVRIDRGTRDGVLAGAPVVAGDGLVGVVAQADSHHALVRLIVAPRMAVSAKVLNAQKLSSGICEGRGESEILLNFLPPEAPIAVGDKVITAGIGSKYPPNLPIGTVERVWLDRQYSVKKAIVRP
ncbi:MAG: rod shape-determining protein MreC, partial [Fimbriimonadales bacterium]